MTAGARRRAASLVIAVALAASTSTSCSGGGGGGRSPSASPPTPVRWIAAGDSYAAGVGAPGNKGRCGITDAAMAPLARSLLDGDVAIDAFTHAACSGAVIDDVLGQVQATKAADAETSVNLVTVTVGGNDVGFAKVLEDCLGLDDVLGRSPGGRSRSCDVTEDELVGRVDALSDRLVALYTSIVAELEPHGVLIVVGYPQVYADPKHWPDATCEGMSKTDATILRAADAELDARTAKAAEAAGATYVSMLDTFEDHEVCGPATRFMNGVKLDRNGPRASFHPNAAGEQAEAAAVADVLRTLYSGS